MKGSDKHCNFLVSMISAQTHRRCQVATALWFDHTMLESSGVRATLSCSICHLVYASHEAVATWRLPKLHIRTTSSILPYIQLCTTCAYSVTLSYHQPPDDPLLYTPACINQAASLQKARNMASRNALKYTIISTSSECTLQ